MDISQYLARIRYQGEITPTAGVLSDLQYANLLAVPFENLDIHLGRAIHLDEQHLFDKIVNQRRGGFCYEQNGLFAWMLKGLGFDVELLSAEVFEDGEFSPEFDHLALRVRLEEDWLVDVGFGDSFVRPLSLNVGGEQIQNDRSYRIQQESNYQVLYQRDGSVDWERFYRFTLEPRRLEEYAGRCRYHQTSPDSHFTQKRICTRLTEYGRITLRDKRLIETRNGRRKETPIPDEDQYLSALERNFQITLTGKL
jgi:N-hydroxyarylamine O-acetyltransferase